MCFIDIIKCTGCQGIITIVLEGVGAEGIAIHLPAVRVCFDKVMLNKDSCGEGTCLPHAAHKQRGSAERQPPEDKEELPCCPIARRPIIAGPPMAIDPERIMGPGARRVGTNHDARSE